MPIVIQPQYADPAIGKIVSNLGTAIYGDPEARMKGAYYGSEVTKNNADARKLGIEADRGQTSLDAYRNLPATMNNLYQVIPGEAAIDRQNRISQGLGALAQAGAPTSTSDDIAKSAGSAMSSIYTSGGAALGNDNMMRGGLNIGGHLPGKDFAGTDAQAKIVSDRDAKAKKDEGVAVAGVNQKGETFRAMNAPIKTAAGETTTLSPNDPRRGVNDKAGVISGMPTKTTVEGAAGAEIAKGSQDPTMADLYYGRDHVAGAKPKSVPAAAVHKISVLALGKLGGVNDATTATAFNGYFGPEKISAAEDAGAQEMAKSGNADAASIAYLDALGLKPGDTFNNPGTMGRLFLGHEQGITPAAAPVAAPVAAAPVITHPTQLPPLAARKVGMVITTPRGDVQWNGQGWVPAGKQY